MAVTLMVLTGAIVIWGRSWFVQTELRWMHDDVHRHLELAKGTVTYVETSNCASADYFVWVSSPDLSFGRSDDWYWVSQPGEPKWHVRLHWLVMSILMTVVCLATVGIYKRTR